MVRALQTLGFEVRPEWEAARIVVDGSGGSVACRSAELLVGNSGTSIRFLTPLCALGKGSYRLDGVARMRQRPIGDLVAALNELGADVHSADGFPPVHVNGRGIRGGNIRIRCDQSSQYLSGLLMALPFADSFSMVQVDGPLVSKPYVNMTCAVMSYFGVDVTRLDEFNEYSVEARGGYDGAEIDIEPDASAASYFWGAAAICGGSVLVPGLFDYSIQGDIRFVEILEQAGCQVDYLDEGIRVTGPARKGVDVDMNDCSDTAQTLAAIAPFLQGPTTIRGIAHNRIKETDRIGHLAHELRRCGVEVEEFDDGMRILPGATRPTTFETYDDHRMAMSLSLIGLRQEGIQIRGAECTAKTYPGFFDDLNGLT